MVIRVYVYRDNGRTAAIFARSQEQADRYVQKWHEIGYNAYTKVIKK